MVDDIDESLNETGTSHYMRARSYWQEVARIRKAHPNCVFVQRTIWPKTRSLSFSQLTLL